VVDAARRWLGTRRVGHLGTLDPLATGVLPLAVREATKLARSCRRIRRCTAA
jgi:tRNA pseudouridine55 synthase